MDSTTSRWARAHKLKYGLGNWAEFMAAVQAKFGAYDYQHAISALLELQQTGSVEEYVMAFEALQFQIVMHDQGMGGTYFISQFIKGLKPEIRYQVEGQVPETMERAIMLAKIQQTIQEKAKSKMLKHNGGSRHPYLGQQKPEVKPYNSTPPVSKERQLRDYCRAKNLCFFCQEPFDALHATKCTKRPKAQANALTLNDLDVTLIEEVLEQLDLEDALAQQFCSLSLNAIAGTDVGEAMRLRALVKKKVMLILVDSGSSHSFVTAEFLHKVDIVHETTTAKSVKVANGDTLITDKIVPGMEWLLQGHTFAADLRVLDIPTYDAILGYDWLSQHSPISHDWKHRTMELLHNGQQIELQWVTSNTHGLQKVSPECLAKWIASNDVWACAPVGLDSDQEEEPVPPAVQEVLDEFQDVFAEPTGLPPERSYDHTIPTIPGAIPVNSKPYRYSPLHKDEIERQVKSLLPAGLIEHSTSRFASPVLLVQKKDGS